MLSLSLLNYKLFVKRLMRITGLFVMLIIRFVFDCVLKSNSKLYLISSIVRKVIIARKD